jgi:uncharacterized protein (TIGR02001 family)
MRATPVFHLIGASILLTLGSHALAQVSGSVALVSDYQYRGVTFSKGVPVPQLTLVYDNPQGWYLGGFVSPIKLRNSGDSALEYIGYAGLARRLASGLSWEGGMSSHVFSGASTMNFHEAYVGLASERVNARISYAPDYLGMNLRTLYAELNASHPLCDQLNLFAHAGFLGSLSGGSGTIRRGYARIGLGTRLAAWDVQLAWAASHENGAGRPAYAAQGWDADKLVLTLMRRF